MRTPARILIADDNPDNLEIFRTRLAVHGYEILTATDGEEALAVARDKQPDLILLDVMMPKMDGIDVCRRLKLDASLPFMPIIMLTAKSSHAGRRHRPRSGRRRVSDQARGSRRAGGPREIDAAHQGAQRHCAGAERPSWPNGTQPLSSAWRSRSQQLEKLSRLKRFFSPQLAEAILSGGRCRSARHPSARGRCGFP